MPLSEIIRYITAESPQTNRQISKLPNYAKGNKQAPVGLYRLFQLPVVVLIGHTPSTQL